MNGYALLAATVLAAAIAVSAPASAAAMPIGLHQALDLDAADRAATTKVHYRRHFSIHIYGRHFHIRRYGHWHRPYHRPRFYAPYGYGYGLGFHSHRWHHGHPYWHHGYHY